MDKPEIAQKAQDELTKSKDEIEIKKVKAILAAIDAAEEEKKLFVALHQKELVMLAEARENVLKGDYDQYMKDRVIIGSVDGVNYGIKSDGSIEPLAPIGDEISFWMDTDNLS